MDALTLTLAQGDLLADRYRIEAVLGEGGMGKVYLARDLLFNSLPVAFKTLHAELCRELRHKQRFLREVELSRMLNHPNVVKVYEVGALGEALYLTMEYVEGMTLKQRLKEGRPSATEIITILKEMCKGLEAVHGANIMHRDLKPGNVLLGKNGEVKIADFGVARPGISELTAHDEVIGCAPYIAPEAWMGRNVTLIADLYALGVIAYEMVSGELPFDGNSPADLMRKHLETKPYPLDELSCDAPPWLNALVMSLLHKDPHLRPQSAAEVSEYLRRGPASLAVRSDTPGDAQVLSVDADLFEHLRLAEESSAGRMHASQSDPEKQPEHALLSVKDSKLGERRQTQIHVATLGALSSLYEGTSYTTHNDSQPVHTLALQDSTVLPPRRSEHCAYVTNVGSYRGSRWSFASEKLDVLKIRSSVMGWLQLGVIGIFALCYLGYLQEPAIVWVTSRISSGALGMQQPFVEAAQALALLYLSCSVAALLPAVVFTLLVPRRRKFPLFLGLWCRVWGMLSVSASMVWCWFCTSLFLYRPAGSNFSLRSLAVAAQSTVQNMAEAVLLLPRGTLYNLLSGSVSMTLIQAHTLTAFNAVPYYTALIFAMFTIALTAKCTSQRYAGEADAPVTQFLLFTITGAIAIELFCAKTVMAWFNLAGDGTLKFTLGTVVLQFTEANLWLAAFNYALIFAVIWSVRRRPKP